MYQKKDIRQIREIRVQQPYASRFNMTICVPPNKIRVIRALRVQKPTHHALTMIPVFSETIRVHQSSLFP